MIRTGFVRAITGPVIAIAIAAAGCGTTDGGRPREGSAPLETEANPVGGLSDADVGMGRSLFERSCDTCHALPSPSVHTDDEWVRVVKTMGRDARITAADQREILRFLQAANGSAR